jgi:two-component system C4-dicarboxylate transport sensor histidine kinase DctB
MDISRFLTVRSVGGWVVVINIMAIVLLGVSTITYKNELIKHSKQNSIRIELFATYLKGVLEKYESLPELLARDSQLVKFMQSGGVRGHGVQVDELNRYLEKINKIFKASDIYLMNRKGLTIAASNWQAERPFIGRNFSYRPYFQQAIKGQLGRYFALGTTSIKRGYYFAYPVTQEKEILGAVVVKINIDDVEQKWGTHDQDFLVTDPDNVIFLTTNPDWRFKTFGEIEPLTKEVILQSKRYPSSQLMPLKTKVIKDYDFGSVIKVIYDDGKEKTYLQQKQHMNEAGWDVRILSDIRPIRQHLLQINILVGASGLLSYLLLIMFAQRRKRLAEITRIETQSRRVLQDVNEKLESRVYERTSELTESNRKLLREIQERKNTEAVLKRTRSELVHAAKLATLGQLSAGINHELNQPLSAIRSYADNSKQLLAKGRADEASWNMEQISELTERMAQVGKQLKAFSRKTSGKLDTVPIHGAIDGALEILAPTIKKSEIEITVEIQPENLEAVANQVLIQQVIVNLLSNAIHAVESQKTRKIAIKATLHNQQVTLFVQDSGAGIASKHLSHIFDPFFTTKKSGQGLGLGLTITERIIHEMNGKITAESTPEGAVFTVTLAAVIQADDNEK